MRESRVLGGNPEPSVSAWTRFGVFGFVAMILTFGAGLRSRDYGSSLATEITLFLNADTGRTRRGHVADARLWIGAGRPNREYR